MGDFLRGFATVELKNVETGEVEGPFTMENQFTNLFRNQVLNAIGHGSAVTSNVAYIAVGTGGAVTGATTAIAGELTGTRAGADTTVSTSSRLRCTGSYASNLNTGNISNMGLYTTDSGSNLIAGNTFSASFAKNASQELSVTYDIIFSS